VTGTSDDEATAAPDRDRARERRRELRDAISGAALDLVLERGLDGVTVDEIARAANVSRRTFFNYFPSKAAACIPRSFPPDVGAVEHFLADRSEPTMDAAVGLLWRHVALADRESGRFREFHDIWRREPSIRPEIHGVLARTEEHLAALVARRDGHPPGSAAPAAVAAAAIAVLRVAVEQWRTDEAPEQLESRIHECFAAVTDSVRAPASS